MAGAEALFNLYLRTKERCLNGCNSFEEHFSWLEEVVTSARQSFASVDPTLLPKTPQLKKKTQKRPLQPSIAEEEESPPAKRISTYKRSNNDAYSPVEVLPRKGRAASMIAQAKMARNLRNDGNRKLRRPSTPTMVATSKKIRGSRCAVQHRNSPEGNCKHVQKSPQSEERRKLSSRNNEKDVKKLTSESQLEQVLDPVSSHDTPKKKRNSTIRLSVNLSKERLPYVDSSQEGTDLQNTPQITVTSVHQENCKDETYITENDGTDPALRLEDRSEEKGNNVQTLEAEIKSKEKDELLPCELSAEKLVKIPISDKENKPCLSPSKDEGVEFLQKTPQKTPVPLPRGCMIRTKQTELQSLNDEDAHNKMLGTIKSPHPVPKLRSVSSKQKKEMHLENTANEESSTHILLPKNIPNTRVTRTKTRAKEQASSTEQEGSYSHLSVKQGVVDCMQTDSLVSEEVPKPRSTRTKEKAVEVEKTHENLTKSQDLEFIKTNKREAEEQTVKGPVRSTRTKRKKIEELSEKDVVDQEIQCLYITDSEEVETKSSQVEMNSTFVKSDSHTTSKNMSENNFSAESVSHGESYTKQSAEVKPFGRVTRSKVRHLLPVNSSPNKSSPSSHIGKNISSPKTPIHTTFKRACCTTNSDSESPKASALRQRGTSVKNPMMHSPRPFLRSGPGHTVCSTTADEHHNREALREVEELTVEDCEVPNSPATITRHPEGKSHRERESSTRRCARKSLKRALKIARGAEEKNTQNFSQMQINNLSKTPSPICSQGKVIHLKTSRILSSGSTYGSSSEYIKTLKRIGTPNEIKRAGNIISGITSFIKIQPAKTLHKDLEEKRLMEMQRKTERIVESQKKKEELLKLKAEEQKRRNEERMKRVQEAREERDRKAMEAKERQEKDKKLREERQKEEQQRRKQHILAKKRAEEEAKVQKIREQEEERRRHEEEMRRRQEEMRRRQEEEIRKLMEEEKRSEEAKRLEEERLAHLVEQRRRQEEEKRRIAESERIARERKELEKLRLREAQRIAEGKQMKIISSETKKVALNDTYTAFENKENGDHNSTFTKTSGSSQPTSSGKTLNLKKIKKADDSVNNYNIDNINSDDSTDDETAPKKKIPSWATSSQLKVNMIKQEYDPPVVEKIFPPEYLLNMPDLSQMFPIQRRRFKQRTSSAVWNSPPANMFQSEYSI